MQKNKNGSTDRDMLIGTIKARLLQGDTEVFTVDMVRKMREGVDGWGNTNGTIKYMEPVFANIIIFQHQEEVKRFVSSHLSVIWKKKEYR